MHLKEASLFTVAVFIALHAVKTARAEENIFLSAPPNTVQADSIPQPAPAPSGPTPTHSSDPGLSQDDLWQRIRNGYALGNVKGPLVANHEQWYANRPDYMQRMTERAKRYLHFIVEEVERRGMPSEIALLPMIESAFNPEGFSTSKASGIWQFIPSTGKNFGMKQNWWYDGRRNIVSATFGALDYLQKLHGMFGDWELALAAYNWGEGAVQRALDRNRKLGLPTNYASLDMPSETRNYIPKLQAIKNIVENPASFGLALHPVPDRPYFTAVSTASNIDVKLAAGLANVSLDEFRALNPAHNRPVILQENSKALLFPVDKVETFRTNLANNSLPLVSWQSYQGSKGEHIDKLASRFGLSAQALRSVNGLPPQARLSTEQMLLVPVNGKIAEPDSRLAGEEPPTPTTQLSGNTARHIVRKGDTLSIISRLYQVSVSKLQEWNANVAILQPGQHIIIAQDDQSSRLPTTNTNHQKISVISKSKKKPVHKARDLAHQI